MAFQGFLKQSTATTFKLGPFVDKGDGVTYETGMAAAMNHADTGVRISKNGGAFAARTTATEPVYDAFGYYLVNLDATDTATVGRLKVIFGAAATCLPCEADFCVLEETTFDALITNAAGAAGGLILNGAANAGTTTFAALTVTGVTTYTGAVVYSSTETHAGNIVQNGAAPLVANVTQINGTAASGSGTIDANIVSISGDTVAADNLEAYCDGTTPIPANTTKFAGQTITCAAGVTIRADVGAAAAPGAANGMLIAGANLATTFATLTVTGACTHGSTVLGNTTMGTLTQTGAVSWGATTYASVAITGAFSVGTTTTLTGAVALSSTLAVTGAITAPSLTLSGALQAATIVSTGTTTLNALTVTNACTHGSTVLGNTTMGTLTQTGAVSWGATTFASATITGNVSVGGTWTTTGTTTLTGAVTAANASNNIVGIDVAKAAGVAWASGAITADVIAGNAIDAATFAADVDAEARGWLGLATANLDTQFTDLPANVATEIGTGTALTAIPWNAAWNTSVQAECTDALNAYDPPTNAEMEARTLATAAYATAANQTTLLTYTDLIDDATSGLAKIATDVAAILVDTGTTLDTMIARTAVICAGSVSGAGTGTEVFAYGTVTGTVTVDVDGNRTIAWS